jgi:GlcNAc-P-P-Und epimerase
MKNDHVERVLVTGGAGFIGTNLVDALLSTGCALASADVIEPRKSAHKAVWHKLDLTVGKDVRDLIESFKPTHIFHLGARTDLKGKHVSDYLANTEGVEHVVNASNSVGTVRRIIFCSSRLVCKIGYHPESDTDYCPTTPYGESKVIGENIVRNLIAPSFEWAIVRPTSIWGPWFDIPYRQFFDHVRSGKYIHPNGRAIKKSFGFVGNSVFQLGRIMSAPYPSFAGKTYYIGDYDPIDIFSFANLVAGAFGREAVSSVPVSVLKMAAIVGDLLSKIGYENPPLTSFRLSNLLTDMIHDFDELRELTGPLPYSIDSGVKMTVDWIKGDDRKLSTKK